MVKIKYDGGIGKWLGGIFIIFLLGFTLVSASDKTEINYQSLLSLDEIDSLLSSYFSSFNATEVYNTYNDYITNQDITNQYITNEYYNVTYLNETLNEYITMTDVYNNYINDTTYTYLNQTFNDFITNEYVTINETYYDVFNDYVYLNQTFTDYVTNNFNDFTTYNYTYIDYIDYITYNQTYNTYISNYLNETINTYVTNNYQEDYYYNTYIYNQTFLNQTFIDNSYYDYSTNTINNTLLEDLMSSVTTIWDIVTDGADDRIVLDGLDSIILTETDCSIVEFMFKDTQLTSIFDNEGFIVSTQLAQAQDIDFLASFFVDNTDNVVINNLNITYDSINAQRDALFSTSAGIGWTAQFNANANVGEIIMNFALTDTDNLPQQSILTFSENGVDVMELFIDNNKIGLGNLATGVQQSLDNCAYGNCIDNMEFVIFKIVVDGTELVLKNEFDDEYARIDNPFSLGENVIGLDSSLVYDESYFRSVYINTINMFMIPDEYLIDGVEFEYDKDVWNQATIYLLGDSALYRINNEVASVNFDVNNVLDYFITFDLTRTSLANLYCRN
ncbi:MAG: hypothetical protein PF569_01980 [Candidatus Woesearchaeota archaeon]|jgi:hypothetical protein|nr:hypothetical protein [Candidatus Woesearchaeota archaeon]